VRAVDARFEAALSTILAPLRERLKRHPRLREEQAKIATLRYRRLVPAEFRIGELETAPDRDALRISEQRLTATWMHSDAWTGDDTYEPGVAIARCTVSLNHGRLKITWVPSVIIGAHGLARRIERGRDRSHAALVADLALLAGASDMCVSIEAGDGVWLGHRALMQGADGTAQMLAIRTYHT
jgi:hypothetical protein